MMNKEKGSNKGHRTMADPLDGDTSPSSKAL
jgi:hypothetical protein